MFWIKKGINLNIADRQN